MVDCKRTHRVSHMQLLELAGLCEMIYASLKSLPHKNPSPWPALVLPVPAPGVPFLGLSMDSSFSLCYSITSPGRNFRRVRISQIKLIIICHLNEVGQGKYRGG